MSTPTWTFQDRLRKAREHAGLTQGALAEILGVAAGTIQRWEKGALNPRPKALEALAETTGVPLEWFHQDDATQPSASIPNLLPPGSTVTWTPNGLRITPESSEVEDI
ncbi:helix-turn-helix domain-containing protein [Rothia nasimurium]